MCKVFVYFEIQIYEIYMLEMVFNDLQAFPTNRRVLSMGLLWNYCLAFIQPVHYPHLTTVSSTGSFNYTYVQIIMTETIITFLAWW